MSQARAKEILLTGINGFIGIHTAKVLLERGYTVTGTVRSMSKTEYIKNLFKDAYEQRRLNFHVVQDITADDAFDEVLKAKAFDAVLHTSSPFTLNVDNPETELLQPAIRGTKSILQSIHKHAPSVKRVIVTSSFASVVDREKGNWPEHIYSEADWNPVTYEQGLQDGTVGYYASKKLAEQTAWNFMKSAQPSFSLTTLCPPMVFGPPEQDVASLSKLNSSAAGMYAVFTGEAPPSNSVWLWVDVRDVALAHVLAIEPEAAANQRYLITEGVYSAQQFVDFIWEHYPDRARAKNITRGTPGKLWPEEGRYTVDNSKSKRDLGLTYRPVDEMMKATFEKFVQLEKEGK